MYEAYATTHAGITELGPSKSVFDRDIASHLPIDRKSRIIDIGCGQGHIVQHLLTNGYVNAKGIDVSPEQVEIARSSGVTSVELGDFRQVLETSKFNVVIATDLLEHLSKEDLLKATDQVFRALEEEGIFIVRVPNATSPFGGRFRYGDLTHELSFTSGSLRQLGSLAGFSSVEFFACSPQVHGAKSLVRAIVWRTVSALMKLALAAETGAVRGHVVTQNIVAVFRKRS